MLVVAPPLRLGSAHPMSQPLLPFPWLDLVLILALVAINGVLSMSELAIVSSREARLKAMAKSGSKGATLCARTGLRSRPVPVDGADRHHADRDPRRRFLRRPARACRSRSAWRCWASIRRPRRRSASWLVIVLTTYASLVIGELVPKQFALRKPEPIAAIMARPMLWLSKVTAPFVWLLDRTSAAIFKALGLDREIEELVSPPRNCTWSSPRRIPRACSRKASARSSRASSGWPIGRCAK